jgi:hypothetical protein
MSLEMVGYIFMGWLATGVITALILGRIIRESSGLPTSATAGAARSVEHRPHRAPRRAAARNRQRHAHQAA